MNRLRWAFAALTLLATPSLGTGATTAIVPHTAIAGVAIGMKEPRVQSNRRGGARRGV